MWGKRPGAPKPDDKRLRCQRQVRDRYAMLVDCGRLAHRFTAEKHGHAYGEFDVCNNHAALIRKEGFTLTPVDRRKKKVQQ